MLTLVMVVTGSDDDVHGDDDDTDNGVDMNSDGDIGCDGDTSGLLLFQM